jgi:hypothetical protein
MTNDESNPIGRMTNDRNGGDDVIAGSPADAFASFGRSSFELDSSFVIRHSNLTPRLYA